MAYTETMEYRFKEDFAFVGEALGLTSEQLCTRIGFSRSGVYKALSGEESPSALLLEAFYAYAYHTGLRINRSKEELFHERFVSTVIYHGSHDGLKAISPEGNRPVCDFGPGFYTGENYRQAASFVADAKQGSVYAFRFDPDSFKGATFTADLEWMLLFCYFRGKLKPYEGHPKLQAILRKIQGVDFVKAPIADNKMFQVMRLFGDGDINSEEALHALSASNLGEQIVLKTESAIKALTPLDRLYLSEPEKRYLLSFTSERAAEVETKLKMAKREFRGKGLYIDEVFA